MGFQAETESGQEGFVWGDGNALKLNCGGGDAELCKIYPD